MYSKTFEIIFLSITGRIINTMILVEQVYYFGVFSKISFLIGFFIIYHDFERLNFLKN